MSIPFEASALLAPSYLGSIVRYKVLTVPILLATGLVAFCHGLPELGQGNNEKGTSIGCH